MKLSSLLWLSPLALLLSCGRPLSIDSDGEFGENDRVALPGDDDTEGEGNDGDGDQDGDGVNDNGGGDNDGDGDNDGRPDQDDGDGDQSDPGDDNNFPMPDPDGCDCEVQALLVVQQCIGQGGDLRACLLKAQPVYESCQDRCGQASDPQPPQPMGGSCDQDCQSQVDVAVKTCLGAGVPEVLCQLAGQRAGQQCFETCAREQQTCIEICVARGDEERRACSGQGKTRRNCENRASEITESCIRDNCQ